jgi:hypothetical protein
MNETATETAPFSHRADRDDRARFVTFFSYTQRLGLGFSIILVTAAVLWAPPSRR